MNTDWMDSRRAGLGIFIAPITAFLLFGISRIIFDGYLKVLGDISSTEIEKIPLIVFFGIGIILIPECYIGFPILYLFRLFKWNDLVACLLTGMLTAGLPYVLLTWLLKERFDPWFTRDFLEIGGSLLIIGLISGLVFWAAVFWKRKIARVSLIEELG